MVADGLESRCNSACGATARSAAVSFACQPFASEKRCTRTCEQETGVVMSTCLRRAGDEVYSYRRPRERHSEDTANATEHFEHGSRLHPARRGTRVLVEVRDVAAAHMDRDRDRLRVRHTARARI